MKIAPKFIAFVAIAAVAAFPQAFAADVLAKYTLNVDDAGYGSLRILDNGIARGSIRYKGRPRSFSAEIVDGRFQISLKERDGVLDAEFAVTSGVSVVSSTLAGEPITIEVNRFRGELPTFYHKRVPASATIDSESKTSSFFGRLTAEGEFYYGSAGRTVLNGNYIPAGTVRKLLHLTFHKDSGLVTGRFNGSAFIGVVESGDTISAICNNGKRLRIETNYLSNISSGSATSTGSSGSSVSVNATGGSGSSGSVNLTGGTITIGSWVTVNNSVDSSSGSVSGNTQPGTISVSVLSGTILDIRNASIDTRSNFTLYGTGQLIADSFANFSGTLTTAADYVNTQNFGSPIGDITLPLTPGNTYPLNSIVIIPAN